MGTSIENTLNTVVRPQCDSVAHFKVATVARRWSFGRCLHVLANVATPKTAIFEPNSTLRWQPSTITD